MTTLPQFLAWMAVAFFSGMLTAGILGLIYVQVLKTIVEVDDMCECGGEEEPNP